MAWHKLGGVGRHRVDGGCSTIGSDEAIAALRLSLVQGLGPVAILRLATACGSARAALEVGADRWASALGCALCRAERCRAEACSPSLTGLASEIVDVTAQLGASVIAMGDPAYPALLRAIPDPPPLLWLRGALGAVDDWAVAVVGSRRCSAYGVDQADRIARGLAQRGHTIVSGGARGIDAAAHRSTLRVGGRTVAVLGSGLARPYPPEHRQLFDDIVAGGGVVLSEHPPTTEPRSAFFPRRNRIIAGMSLAVVLIEARARSGAAITARLAVEDLGRDAMAVPGRVDSPTSEGAHRAIREGWAALVTSAEDVVEQLRLSGATGSLVDGVRGLGSSVGGTSEGGLLGTAGLESGDVVAGAPSRVEGGIALDREARWVAARLVEHGRIGFDGLVELARAGTDLGDREAAPDAGSLQARLTLLEIAGLAAREESGEWAPRTALMDALGPSGRSL